MSNALPSPPDWQPRRIGTLGEWSGGQTPFKSNPGYWQDGTILWVSPKDITAPVISDSEDKITPNALANTRLRHYPTTSVIVVVRSGILRHRFPVARSTKSFTVNQDLKVLIANDDIDPQFIFCILTYLGPTILRRVVKAGTTVESVDIPAFLKLEITTPPFLEQCKIARILTTLDNLIERTETLIAKYQAIKQGMMHDLFTRGVDENRQLRPPQAEAPDLYKQSELGWIPKEWEVASAERLCHEITKGSTPSDLFAEDGPGRIPFIRVQNLSFDGTLLFDTEKSFILSSVHDTTLIRSKVFPGDILMNLVGPPMGKVSLVPDAHSEWNINQAIAIFRTLDVTFRQFLLLHLLSRRAFAWFLSRAKRTSGQQNLTLEMCKQLPVPIPQNRSERDQITSRFCLMDQTLVAEWTILRKLRALKTGLMQDLLTGKVRVKVDEPDEASADV